MEKTKEILEDYFEKICKHCTNKNADDCDIHKTNFGAKCANYKYDHVNFGFCISHECAFCPQKDACSKKYDNK